MFRDGGRGSSLFSMSSSSDSDLDCRLPSYPLATPELRMNSTWTERNQENWWIIQEHQNPSTWAPCSVLLGNKLVSTVLPGIKFLSFERRGFWYKTLVCMWTTLLLIRGRKISKNEESEKLEYSKAPEKYFINKTGFQRWDLYHNLRLPVFFSCICYLINFIKKNRGNRIFPDS